jgi:cytochrome c553
MTPTRLWLIFTVHLAAALTFAPAVRANEAPEKAAVCASCHGESDVMGPIAATLEKQDMRDLAAFFAGKPWPALNQPRAPEDVARHAETVDNSAGCKGCHLANWQGDSTTPRLAGQQLGYLRATMAAFRDGTRANNPWMAALLKTYSDADIDALAKYLAGM